MIMRITERLKKFVWSIPLFREIYILFDEKKRFLSEANYCFSKDNRFWGSYDDYKAAFRKHRVTFSEYMYSYEYWNRDEKQRDEFISTSEMQCIYRKLGNHEVRDIFHDKVRFLQTFSPFIHRWWAVAGSVSYDVSMKNSLNLILSQSLLEPERCDDQTIFGQTWPRGKKSGCH